MKGTAIHLSSAESIANSSCNGNTKKIWTDWFLTLKSIQLSNLDIIPGSKILIRARGGIVIVINPQIMEFYLRQSKWNINYLGDKYIQKLTENVYAFSCKLFSSPRCSLEKFDLLLSRRNYNESIKTKKICTFVH